MMVASCYMALQSWSKIIQSWRWHILVYQVYIDLVNFLTFLISALSWTVLNMFGRVWTVPFCHFCGVPHQIPSAYHWDVDLLDLYRPSTDKSFPSKGMLKWGIIGEGDLERYMYADLYVYTSIYIYKIISKDGYPQKSGSVSDGGYPCTYPSHCFFFIRRRRVDVSLRAFISSNVISRILSSWIEETRWEKKGSASWIWRKMRFLYKPSKGRHRIEWYKPEMVWVLQVSFVFRDDPNPYFNCFQDVGVWLVNVDVWMVRERVESTIAPGSGGWVRSPPCTHM